MLLLGIFTVVLLAIGCYSGGRVATALISRALDLSERKITLLEKATRGPAIPLSIPPDLYRRITKWGNAEAQEAERKVLLDLYQEFQDAPDPWVEVRVHLSPEPNEALPESLFTGGVIQ